MDITSLVGIALLSAVLCVIVRQYKHMAGYRDTLERRMDRVCERLVPERKETKHPDSKEK